MIRSRRIRIVVFATVVAVATSLATPAQAAPRQVGVSTGNPCFVQAAYLNLLGRFPTFEERNEWVAEIEGGLDRGSLAVRLAHSPEWARQVVTDLYLDILDRSPDPSGLQSWSTRLVAGTRTAEVGSDLYGSKEYFDKAGGTNGDYVDAVYENLLGRLPDDEGRAYWIDRLDRGAETRVVARQFFLSLESNGKRVDTLYRHLLGRDSDPEGRSFWAQRLVKDDALVLAGLLVGSQEFFDGHAQCVIDPDVPTGPGDPGSTAADVNTAFVQAIINSTRKAEGTGDAGDPLPSDPTLGARARQWAQRSARDSSVAKPPLTDIYGETHDECLGMDSVVFMASGATTARVYLLAQGRHLMLDSDWDRMGIGIHHAGSYAWVVVVFVDDNTCPDDDEEDDE